MGHPNTSTATKKSCTSGRAGGLNGDQPRADWPAHAGNNNGSRFRFLSLWGGGKNHDLISTGVIPRSLLRRDSRVGWVESFGFAQDRLRDTHRSPQWVSALCVSTHPTISLDVLVPRYPEACCGVAHFARRVFLLCMIHLKSAAAR